MDVEEILHIPQIAMIGALIKIWKPIAKNIWICVMSLVERVTRLAIENFLIYNC